MKKMKKNLFSTTSGIIKKGTVAALCLILSGLFLVAGCKKDAPKNITGCNVDNPLTDLPWLKEIIDGLEKDSESGYKHHARIYQCYYKDGIGFLLELCVGCPDFGYWLKNCEGESLCVIGGIAGDTCSEFDIDFENVILLWEINN